MAAADLPALLEELNLPSGMRRELVEAYKNKKEKPPIFPKDGLGTGWEHDVALRDKFEKLAGLYYGISYSANHFRLGNINHVGPMLRSLAVLKPSPKTATPQKNNQWLCSLHTVPNSNQKDFCISLTNLSMIAHQTGHLYNPSTWKSMDDNSRPFNIAAECLTFIAHNFSHTPASFTKPSVLLWEGALGVYREMVPLAECFKLNLFIVPIPENKAQGENRYMIAQRLKAPATTRNTYNLFSYDMGNEKHHIRLFWCCAYCRVSTDTKLFKCTKCRIASYCSQDCQQKDWKYTHSAECSVFVEVIGKIGIKFD